jgi:hypothetical protein
MVASASEVDESALMCHTVRQPWAVSNTAVPRELSAAPLLPQYMRRLVEALPAMLGTKTQNSAACPAESHRSR